MTVDGLSWLRWWHCWKRLQERNPRRCRGGGRGAKADNEGFGVGGAGVELVVDFAGLSCLRVEVVVVEIGDAGRVATRVGLGSPAIRTGDRLALGVGEGNLDRVTCKSTSSSSEILFAALRRRRVDAD